MNNDPVKFSYLQLAAPIILLILTKLKIPVSTTFMILTCFTTTAKSFNKIVLKSIVGYGLALGVSFVLYLCFGKPIH